MQAKNRNPRIRVIYVLSILALLLSGNCLYKQISHVHVANSPLQLQLQTLKEERSSLIRAQRALIEQAGRAQVSRYYLSRVTALMPAAIHITSFRFDHIALGRRITLSGSCDSREHLTKYLDRLRQVAFSRDIQLRQVQPVLNRNAAAAQAGATTDLLQFRITLDV